MADLLLVDSKFNDPLLGALSVRYERSGGDDGLDPEKQWIIALHQELKKRIKLVAPPYRSLGDTRLAYWFGKVKDWTASREKAVAKKHGSETATGSKPTL
jgi:hypothetical protein